MYLKKQSLFSFLFKRKFYQFPFDNYTKTRKITPFNRVNSLEKKN